MKTTTKKFLQESWVVLFKHTDGWTVSSIEFHRDSAENEMKRQKYMIPSFKYKIAPCKIWVAQHYLR